MKRPTPIVCLLVLLGSLALVACGSGGGNVRGGPIGGGLTAVFTPDDTSPGANSISMAAGTSADDTFQIVVNVTDIVDFFGTAFRIRFDPVSAEFVSFDDATSFLYGHDDAPVVDIRAVVDPGDAGAVLVVATLQNTFAYVRGLDAVGDQELLTLTFRAIDPTAGNGFSFDSALTREVTVCPPWSGGGSTPDCPEIADGTLNWNGGVMTAN